MRGLDRIASLAAALLVDLLLVHPLAAQAPDSDGDIGVENRIVFGKPADHGSFSNVVKIELRSDGSLGSCTGSIIDSEWVLTAAHCVSTSGNRVYAAEKFSVLYGSSLLSGAKKIGVSQVHVHRSYDADTRLSGNDIALLRLNAPVQLPRQMLATAATRSELERPRSMAMVVGFGKTEKGELSDRLLRGDVPLVSRSDCQAAFASSIAQNRIGALTVCAGWGRPGQQDSCSGDSGGPLMVEAASGNRVQVGVVSWGAKDCVNARSPGVYASVAYFESWIRQYVPNARFHKAESGVPNRPPVNILPRPPRPSPGQDLSGMPQLTLDIVQGETLRVDTKATLRLTSSIGGYLVVFAIDARNEVTQIAPNKHSGPDGPGRVRSRLRPAEVTLLPGPTDGYRLDVGKQTGESHVIALVLPPSPAVEAAIGRHLDLQPILDGRAYIAALTALAGGTGGTRPGVAMSDVKFTVVAR